MQIDRNPDYKVLLFYKYVDLEFPESWRKKIHKLCQNLNLTGRIIIASEGVNGTLEGKNKEAIEFVKLFKALPEFSDVKFKISDGTGQAFPKLSVKTRNEIVTTNLGDNNFSPNQITGKYLEAEELHQWFQSDKEFYIVDMRNDYEHKVGHFENSILLNELKHFRDLPKILPRLENLKNKTIVTVCTGGIRCEKASGFLVKNGFADVYQLKDGIVTYMEKYPNQNFLGKLFVFDGRVAMGFNVNDKQHKTIGKCDICGKPSENFVDYFLTDKKPLKRSDRIYGIVCKDCIAAKKVRLDVEVLSYLTE